MLLRIMMVILFVSIATTGCGSGDLTLDQADPGAVAAEPTWGQVFSIFQRECAPCHTDSEDGEDGVEGRSAGPMRLGGVEPDLQSCAGIIENLSASMQRIFESNDMPPGAWPRLTSEERLILERWRNQGGDAPCR